jgi:hypothetical protein
MSTSHEDRKKERVQASSYSSIIIYDCVQTCKPPTASCLSSSPLPSQLNSTQTNSWLFLHIHMHMSHEDRKRNACRLRIIQVSYSTHRTVQTCKPAVSFTSSPLPYNSTSGFPPPIHTHNIFTPQIWGIHIHMHMNHESISCKVLVIQAPHNHHQSHRTKQTAN